MLSYYYLPNNCVRHCRKYCVLNSITFKVYKREMIQGGPEWLCRLLTEQGTQLRGKKSPEVQSFWTHQASASARGLTGRDVPFSTLHKAEE